MGCKPVTVNWVGEEKEEERRGAERYLDVLDVAGAAAEPQLDLLLEQLLDEQARLLTQVLREHRARSQDLQAHRNALALVHIQ